ncbi:N-acetylmuramoyl-L-alanine amidase [Aequoribacter fuscus]|jgi:N-acetylmuramoyl-L-alanine amidase|uniref:N-acetylmuramoyl-L-alanine amidase AmiC n=1 Tax=Aequoribacter fuscus TaxID=2518989 RepID=F3L1V6_9GAMM|nr:N-acetylmuramoyl-L-alanine amidase [Aequoribacter fuscus]EGG29718.1 N-acetylmuramoyl-L-alanine amidase [Aequoribacter fuscus]QHJ88987.1 AMIN domain-containing protein [Aequoribacter fuscus]
MVLRWRLGLVVLCLLLSESALSAKIEELRLWRAPDHTRLVFDLSEPADHTLLELKNPDRLVIDIKKAEWGSTPDLELDGTPIKGVRTAVRNDRDIRVVLDLKSQVKPRSFALKATDTKKDRLVIDLVDPAAPPKVVARKVDNSEKRDIIVAIDAGHGGEDPGAIGPGKIQEKKVVLAIAAELRQLFEDAKGYQPVMIRTGDYYVSLSGRRKLARDAQADVFISIHADAFTNPQANGASVYALSLRGASSTAARYLAQRENAADLVGGVTLSDKDDVLASVLTDLSMTSTLDRSLQMGSSVLAEMGNVARLHKDHVEQAAFAVLKSPDIPSILVETGFISNPTEARRLNNSAYRRKMANAIFAGVSDHFYAQPPPGTYVAWSKEQGQQTYTIARGDTLSGIAQKFKVSVESLRSHNNINGSRILVGQTLVIPRS